MPQVNTDDGAIAYELIDHTAPEVETPQTILFHHGVGIDRGIWTGWLPQLIDRFRIVRLDMRGFGESVVPPGDYAWSMARLAADVIAVADHAGLARFHFVGESLGGAMAFHLALHHPDRLLSIAPCTSPHRGGAVQWLKEWRDYIQRNGMAGWSERMMERRFPPGLLSQSAWDWFHKVQSACAADSILGTGEMLLDLDLSDRLAEIATPTLLIAAERSPFLPLALTLEIHQAMAQSELQVFAGARHGVVYSHGPACATAYRAFLTRQGLA